MRCVVRGVWCEESASTGSQLWNKCLSRQPVMDFFSPKRSLRNSDELGAQGLFKEFSRFPAAGFQNGRLWWRPGSRAGLWRRPGPERAVLAAAGPQGRGYGGGRVPERAVLAAAGFQNGRFWRRRGSRTGGSGGERAAERAVLVASGFQNGPLWRRPVSRAGVVAAVLGQGFQALSLGYLRKTLS